MRKIEKRQWTEENRGYDLAVTTEYQRRLNRTSSTGLTRKVQKPGEIITAVIAAIVASGTWRAFSNLWHRDNEDAAVHSKQRVRQAHCPGREPSERRGAVKRYPAHVGLTVSSAFEAGDSFDVLGERHQIECRERAESRRTCAHACDVSRPASLEK